MEMRNTGLFLCFRGIFLRSAAPLDVCPAALSSRSRFDCFCYGRIDCRRTLQLVVLACLLLAGLRAEGQTLATLTPSSGTLSAIQTFTWKNGVGPSAYRLLLGTIGVGTDNLYSSGSTTATSVTVTLPTDGVTIFARFYQEVNGVWQYSDSTYTESGKLVLATLIPALSKVLSTSQNFDWENGAGPTGYELLLGTSGAGSSNLYTSGITTATSATITLPANGVTIFARFYQRVNGVWQYSDNTYTEPGTLELATLSPISPAVLTTSQTFSWNNANGATNYRLWLGTGGAGSNNLYNSGATAAGSVTVTLPTNGAAVWARFFQFINGAWQYADSTYTESVPGSVSALSCSSGSVTGAASVSCQVTLAGEAGTSGQTVSLSSNSVRVVVPSSVTVAAGANSATFTAAVQAAPHSLTAILSANSGGMTETFAIDLVATVATLTLESTTVPFGDVSDGIPSYQSVSLTDSGLYTLTISAGTITGTGFTISRPKFPLSIMPGDSASLEIEFDPTTPGVSDGSVTLTSNSSTGTTSSISLSGTGITASYEVNLTWDAPTDSPDAVAGYSVYRAISGSSTYELLNSSLDATTAYTDATVQGGTSYSYYVESVDGEGNHSVPSNDFAVSVP
jgi:hypothetical protein